MPQVVGHDGVPVVKIRPTKPKLRVVEETNSAPPPVGIIRSGADGPRGEAEAGSLTAKGVRGTSETASPHRISPDSEHARRAKERGAAAAAPAPRATPAPYLYWWEVPKNAAAIDIADGRGIAVCDLARALGRRIETVLGRLRKLGRPFGKRPPLADPMTLEQLLALRDPSIPLPELRSDRLYRERLEREARLKRERREAARKDDHSYTPRGPRTRLHIDVANKRRADSAKRATIAKAEARLDAGATRSGNIHINMAMRVVEAQRAEEARRACPIEQAKLVLQRRGRIVYSMAVHGGASDLYFISGLGKDLTAEQLLTEAERVAR